MYLASDPALLMQRYRSAVLISKDGQIAGYAAIDVRKVTRFLRHTAVTIGALAEELEVSGLAAKAMVEALAEAGLIDHVERPSRYRVADDEDDLSPPALWATTLAGSAVAKARIGKPMPRREAEQLLADLLHRVELANASGDWLDSVAKVVVFGSFVSTDKPEVGDVDIAVWLAPRFEHEEYLRKQEELVRADDAHPRNIVDSLFYARRQLLRYLRGRSTRIDLQDHSGDQPLPPGAKSRVAYELPKSDQ